MVNEQHKNSKLKSDNDLASPQPVSSAMSPVRHEPKFFALIALFCVLTILGLFNFFTSNFFIKYVVLLLAGRFSERAIYAEAVYYHPLSGELIIVEPYLGYPGNPALQGGELRGILNLKALLHDFTLDISDIELTKSQLNLVCNAEGEWSFAASKVQLPGQATDKRSKIQQSPPGNRKNYWLSQMPDFKLKLSNVTLQDSKLLIAKNNSTMSEFIFEHVNASLNHYMAYAVSEFNCAADLQIRNHQQTQFSSKNITLSLNFRPREDFSISSFDLMVEANDLSQVPGNFDLSGNKLKFSLNGRENNGIILKEFALQHVNAADKVLESVSGSGNIQYNPFLARMAIEAATPSGLLPNICTKILWGIDAGDNSMDYSGVWELTADQISSNGKIMAERSGNITYGDLTIKMAAAQTLKASYGFIYNYHTRRLQLNDLLIKLSETADEYAEMKLKKPLVLTERDFFQNKLTTQADIVLHNVNIYKILVSLQLAEPLGINSAKLSGRGELDFTPELISLKSDFTLDDFDFAYNGEAYDGSGSTLQLNTDYDFKREWQIKSLNLELQSHNLPVANLAMKGNLNLNDFTGVSNFLISGVTPSIIYLIPPAQKYKKVISHNFNQLGTPEAALGGVLEVDLINKIYIVNQMAVNIDSNSPRYDIDIALQSPVQIKANAMEKEQDFKLKLKLNQLPLHTLALDNNLSDSGIKSGNISADLQITGNAQTINFNGQMQLHQFEYVAPYLSIPTMNLQSELDFMLMLNNFDIIFNHFKLRSQLDGNQFGDTEISGAGRLEPSKSHMNLQFNMKAAEFLTFWPWSDVCTMAGTDSDMLIDITPGRAEVRGKTKCRRFVLTPFDLYASGVADWNNITTSDDNGSKSITTVTADFIEKDLPILSGTMIMTSVSDADKLLDVVFKLSEVHVPNFRFTDEPLDNFGNSLTLQFNDEVLSEAVANPTALLLKNDRVGDFDFYPTVYHFDIKELYFNDFLKFAVNTDFSTIDDTVTIAPSKLAVNDNPPLTLNGLICNKSGVVEYLLLGNCGQMDISSILNYLAETDQIKCKIGSGFFNIYGQGCSFDEFIESMDGNADFKMQNVTFPNTINHNFWGRILLIPFEIISSMEMLLPIGEEKDIRQIVEYATGFAQYDKLLKFKSGEIKLSANDGIIAVEKCIFKGDAIVNEMIFSGIIKFGPAQFIYLQALFNLQGFELPFEIFGTPENPQVRKLKILQAILKNNVENLLAFLYIDKIYNHSIRKIWQYPTEWWDKNKSNGDINLK